MTQKSTFIRSGYSGLLSQREALNLESKVYSSAVKYPASVPYICHIKPKIFHKKSPKIDICLQNQASVELKSRVKVDVCIIYSVTGCDLHSK